MSFRRAGVLLGQEILQGSRDVVFVWAIVAPIAISLMVSLTFGTLFSEKPRLGILDEGDSRVVGMVRELDSVVAREYTALPEMTQAAEAGAVDIGIVLPEGFDGSVVQGQPVEIRAYVWGQSLAKNRSILGATIATLARGLTAQEAPIEINAVSLGDADDTPLHKRLLPFIVLMTVFVGGLFLPATSVIREKERDTLRAVVMTPASVADVFLAKGAFGVAMSLVMGALILALNQAFTGAPLLLALVLALGAVMATEIGLITGALLKDTTTLFAVWKTAGILLFGPGIVYLFPQIPEWVGRLFPTYYLIQPLMEISQRGATWPDVAVDVSILVALDLLLAGLMLLASKRALAYAS